MKGISSFREELHKLVGDEYSVIESVYNPSTKLTKYKIRHNICGREYFNTRYKVITRGQRCRECLGLTKRNTEWYKQKVSNLVGKEYLVTGEYMGTHIKIGMTHTLCGEEYLVSPNKFLNGRRCPTCSHPSRLKTTEQFKEELSKNRADLIVVGDYSGKNEPIEIHHTGCNSSFWIAPENLLISSYCRICEDPVKSLGEDKITELLLDKDIIFQREYRFPDCKDQRELPFDFAIFDDNELVLLIEYNGKQHYEEGLFTPNLDDRQNKDKIKSDYAVTNNINLCVIPYTEFDNITEILVKELKDMNLI